MQLTASLLMANPCDDEEDDMALLCCHGAKGEMFLMTRCPGDEELEVTLDDEPYLLRDLKVTVSPTRVRVEIAAADAAAFNGDDLLEITHSTAPGDMEEVLQTLRNLLNGVGTLVVE
jgi:hypothetical protein